MGPLSLCLLGPALTVALLGPAAEEEPMGTGEARDVAVSEEVADGEPEAPRIDASTALPFGQLLADPAPHLGQERVLLLHFDQVVESWEPFLTRFGPERHLALRAWADEQPLWVQGEFESPAVFVFARKDSPVAGQLRAAGRHQRFAARVVLRQLLAGKAWIEVVELERQPRELGEGSLLHAIRGFRLEREGAFELAADQFERALAAPLPLWIEEELGAERERCLERAEGQEPPPAPRDRTVRGRNRRGQTARDQVSHREVSRGQVSRDQSPR